VLSADWLAKAVIISEMSLEPWSVRASTKVAGRRPRGCARRLASSGSARLFLVALPLQSPTLVGLSAVIF